MVKEWLGLLPYSVHFPSRNFFMFKGAGLLQVHWFSPTVVMNNYITCDHKRALDSDSLFYFLFFSIKFFLFLLCTDYFNPKSPIFSLQSSLETTDQSSTSVALQFHLSYIVQS